MGTRCAARSGTCIFGTGCELFLRQCRPVGEGGLRLGLDYQLRIRRGGKSDNPPASSGGRSDGDAPTITSFVTLKVLDKEKRP